MSIIIKGMEMPVTCCYCPLIGYDPDIEWNDGGRETQGAYICVLTHELIDNTKREEHCPLVPVPPHGDLIDKDETMNAILEQRGEDTACWFAGIVNDMPAVIPSDKAEEGES